LTTPATLRARELVASTSQYSLSSRTKTRVATKSIVRTTRRISEGESIWASVAMEEDSNPSARGMQKRVVVGEVYRMARRGDRYGTISALLSVR